ncbi:beta-ketoacyl-[acyl-carrier-protein] synthase family protein [Aquimarina megaterium]|uniref:beta-ketoacyl-[acyl-carrier-protein] synthase family protein n=1 Tax=Aquimarina megaterium TaxID=1443666 RepID=UPI000942304F|nr:beta-ketoacyl-[acyl-carrier-protein] synthase family protein [Aquimarina megaterium]
MKRVVITGLGVVSPIGSNIQEFWKNVKEKNTGIRHLTKLDSTRFKGNSLSAEVIGEDVLTCKKDISSYSTSVEYAYKASKMALIDAGLSEKIDYPNRYGIILGTTNGTEDIVERTIDTFDIQNEKEELSTDAKKMLSYFRPIEMSSMVAKLCNLGGTNMVIPTACTAGNYAFGTAFSMIKEGRSKVMLAGGSDPFTRSCYTIFYRLGAMTKENIKPFAEDRTGMVVGEGAGIMVLEELKHALERGAKIYGEISGYGLSCDAYHPTAPDPDGNGAALAMKKALEYSGLTIDDISYISAHGTGTKANDSHEVNAMYKVFGEKLTDIPIHCLKSVIGHCMGAASAFEGISAVLSLQEQIIPSTKNTEKTDESFPISIDLNTKDIKQTKITNIMSNSFAFGGNICSLIFSQYN